MIGRQELERELDAVGRAADDGIDVGNAALALAALDHPGLDLTDYRAHLQVLASTAERLAAHSADAGARAVALRETIHVRHGYQGDTVTYDDMQNADLIRVIDRRRGLPVALGILYLHVARAQGWSLVGLSFPGHFLLQLAAHGERRVLDPFRGGAELDAAALRALLQQMHGADANLTAEHLQPVGARDVLLRLQNNIKTRALQAKDFDRAATVLRSMVLIAPVHALSWRELGLVEAERGNLQHAMSALQSCLTHAADEGLRRDAASHLQRLRTRLN